MLNILPSGCVIVFTKTVISEVFCFVTHVKNNRKFHVTCGYEMRFKHHSTYSRAFKPRHYRHKSNVHKFIDVYTERCGWVVSIPAS